MLFSTFPRGWPGAGMLLLRAVVGLTAVVDGWMILVSPEVSPIIAWGVGASAISVGVALLIGFVTPIPAMLVGMATLGVALGWIPRSLLHLVDSTLAGVFLVSMCVAIVLLGPGALSVDARMRGRREIVIPHDSRPVED